MRNLNDLIREHKNVKKALAEYLGPAPQPPPAARPAPAAAGGPAIMGREQPAEPPPAGELAVRSERSDLPAAPSKKRG